MKTLQRIGVVWICLAVMMITAEADWNRFRGPNGSGIGETSETLPTRWSPDANLKWKAALPGPGVSSPIVVGDRVYVTCYAGYGLSREAPGELGDLERHLVCLDKSTGKQLWQSTVDAVLPEDPYTGAGVPSHGYASSTPTSDGESLFVFFGKSGALGFGADGAQLWQTAVGTESDRMRWGSASSPILYKDLVIVPATAESEALVALDKSTGKEVWRQEASGLGSSWSTPILVPVEGGRTDLVLGVPNEIWGLNPETGELRWYCEGVGGDQFCSSVVAHDGVIYGFGGRGGSSLAVRAGGTGDVGKTHVVWTGSDASRFSSPLVHDGRIYTVTDGFVTVIDARTGERLSRTRMAGSGGGGMGGDYASPVLSGDHLYYVRKSGETLVYRLAEEPELVGANRSTEAREEFSGSPAVSGGQIFLRSDKHLYCVADLGQSVPDMPIVVAQAGGEAAAPPGGGRRGGNRPPGGGFDPASMIQRSDRDGDGKLSGDEVPEFLRDRMEQIDTNSDGAITAEEFGANARRMFGGRGRGQGGSRPGGPGGDQGGPSKPDRPQRPPLEA